MKRHTCIICGKKRYEFKMKNVFKSSWACEVNDSYFVLDVCSSHSDIYTMNEIISLVSELKIISTRNFI